MNNNLINASAKIISDAFFKSAEESLKIGKDHLVSMASGALLHALANVSGIFVLEIINTIFKSFREQDNHILDIKRQLSKLIKEPLQTGLEQFTIADELKPSDENQNNYRRNRYMSALENLDKAYSLASETEKPLISLFRGLVATRIPEAEAEAVLHLEKFIEACTLSVHRHDEQIAEMQSRALAIEDKAKSIKVIEGHACGGGLFPMAIAENKIKKENLLYESSSCRNKIEELKSDKEYLISAKKSTEVLINIVRIKNTADKAERKNIK